jgi:hypothetical protein
VATHTHPGPWFLEDEATVLTVVQVLEDQAERMEAARKGKSSTPRR